MRRDKKTGQLYEDFRDWLLYDGHSIWVISLFFAVAAYFLTTGLNGNLLPAQSKSTHNGLIITSAGVSRPAVGRSV